MKIRFRKKGQGEWLVLFVLLMPFLFFVLTEGLGLPALVKYLADLGWLMLLALLLGLRGRFPNVHTRKMAALIGAFFLYGLIGYIVNYQSALYYLWGVRNNMRFFVFFFACVFFLQERSLSRYLRFFDMVFWINLPVVLYQHLVLGYVQDYLGGVFGTEKGCNSYMNLFLVIVVAKSLLCYLYREETFPRFMSKFISAIAIAVLSELKVFFMEVLVIFVMAMMLTRITSRKLILTLVITLILAIGTQLVEVMFADFSGWFAVDQIIRSLSNKSGYTGSGDLNRFTAVPTVLEKWLPSWFGKLFGLGLGNCDYASYGFLTTPFYRAHRNMHYTWFSSAMLVLETGLVGLTLYTLFFVMVYLGASRQEKTGGAEVRYCHLAKIMAVTCIAMMIYNSSLRTEAAYMAYFVMALPFVRRSETRERRSL